MKLRMIAIFAVYTTIFVLLCTGCSSETVLDNLDKTRTALEDIAGGKVDAEEEILCKGNLNDFVYMLSSRQGADACVYLSSLNFAIVEETYDQLMNDPNNAELNKRLINEITAAVFDKDIGINYDTISEMKFRFKEMTMVGENIRAKCYMINNGIRYDVIVRWTVDDSKSMAGIDFANLESILLDD